MRITTTLAVLLVYSGSLSAKAQDISGDYKYSGYYGDWAAYVDRESNAPPTCAIDTKLDGGVRLVQISLDPGTTQTKWVIENDSGFNSPWSGPYEVVVGVGPQAFFSSSATKHGITIRMKGPTFASLEASYKSLSKLLRQAGEDIDITTDIMQFNRETWHFSADGFGEALSSMERCSKEFLTPQHNTSANPKSPSQANGSHPSTPELPISASPDSKKMPIEFGNWDTVEVPYDVATGLGECAIQNMSKDGGSIFSFDSRETAKSLDITLGIRSGPFQAEGRKFPLSVLMDKSPVLNGVATSDGKEEDTTLTVDQLETWTTAALASSDMTVYLGSGTEAALHVGLANVRKALKEFGQCLVTQDQHVTNLTGSGATSKTGAPAHLIIPPSPGDTQL